MKNLHKEVILDVRKVSPHKNPAGRQAYVTTLPAEWIRKNKLENGARLVVKEDADGNIVFEKP